MFGNGLIVIGKGRTPWCVPLLLMSRQTICQGASKQVLVSCSFHHTSEISHFGKSEKDAALERDDEFEVVFQIPDTMEVRYRRC